MHSSVNGALSTVIEVYFTYHSNPQIESLNIHPPTQFKFPKFTIHQAICDVSEGADRVTEATEVVQTMESELGKDPRMYEVYLRAMGAY